MENIKNQKPVKNKKETSQKAKGFPLRILKPIADFLRQEMSRLENKKKAIAKEDPFLDTNRISDNASPDTDVVEQIGHERVKALENQVNRKLIQVKKALARVKIGKYGICEKCSKMIDTDRLMVLPETTFCVSCEKKKGH